MQDRYAGDIGDFGKFGLLKAVEQQGLFIGINWYLTYPAQNEKKRADGNKPIDKIYAGCDEILFTKLCRIFEMPDRSVEELEKRKLLQNAVYYRKPVTIGTARYEWHQKAMKKLASAEVVFLDPDNGLITRTTGRASPYAVKYIMDDEIRDYLNDGKAIIFYQHRPREKENIYFSKMRERIRAICDEIPCQIMSMTFRRGTVRDYFICPEGRYFEQMKAAGSTMINSAWGQSPCKRKGPIVSRFQIEEQNREEI